MNLDKGFRIKINAYAEQLRWEQKSTNVWYGNPEFGCYGI